MAPLSVPFCALLMLATPDAGSPDAGAAAETDGGAAAHTGAGTATPGARASARNEHTEGMERLKDGRVEEAVALFSAAVEHDPGNAGYATDLGFALGRLGRRAE